MFHNSSFPGRIILVLALLFAAGCKKEEDKGSVTGNVSVESGGNDNVIVDLYTPPTIATTSVWLTTATNPSIGFPYNLQAAWDYRYNQHLRVATVTTGSDGKFEFPDIADGNYIIFARKSGSGWSVPRTITVRGGALNVGQLTLPVLETMPPNAVITANTQWLSGRHYLIQDGMSIMSGATLTIEPGAVVRLTPYSSIRVLGTLVAEGLPDQYIVFTSTEPIPRKSDWDYIFFSTSDNPPHFRYCSFNYADQAIRSTEPGGRIEYCYFGMNGAYSASLDGETSATLDSLIFRRNVLDNMSIGLIASNVISQRPMLIEKNAFFNCSQSGMQLENVRGGAVYCNWLYNCAQIDTSSTARTGALFLHNLFYTEIYRNEFRKAYYGIDLGSRVDSSVHIHHNFLYVLSYGMRVGMTLEGRYPSFPRFNNNCLQSITSYFILMESCFVNDEPIDATNNFWDGHNEDNVPIFDHDEEPLCPYVSLTPVLSSCPRTDVGVCGD